MFDHSHPSRRDALRLGAAGAAFAGLPPVQALASTALDPESDALNMLLAGPEATPLHRQAISAVRRELENAGALMQADALEVASVEDTTTPSIDDPVRVRIYRPNRVDAGSPPILVYCHGGYFLAGSVDTHDHVARRLCTACDAMVISVDYRLAPDHPFPTALNDCTEVLRWASERGAALGGDPARIGLVGDDAGGTIAAGVALRLRFNNLSGFKFLGLLTPILLLDQSLPFESRAAYGQGGYRPSMADLDWMRARYLGDAPAPGEPSPLALSTLKGLPVTLMITAGFDAFRDEAGFFVRRLREDGVRANERVFESTIHDFMFYPQIVPAARSAFEVVGAQFKVAVG